MTTAAPSQLHPFDWREQWYAVAFAEDLPLGQPKRIEIFDEPLVVARRTAAQGGGVVALADRCPHRMASLSEGRLTGDGQLQCAYHGWTFEGQSGTCTWIPQISGSPDLTISGRTCATAFPCVELQGVVWVYAKPGAAPSRDSIPTVPYLDQKGWIADDYVRDFPLDFSVLAENLTDPDHGVFAHQAMTFDMYAADSTHPPKISVKAGNNNFSARSTVLAVPKLMKTFGQQVKPGKEPLDAVVEFKAPGHMLWYRADASGATRFMLAFYVLPQGLSRTRLMIRVVRQGPKLPRWLFNMFQNRFLDQDSFLLATQQEKTLAVELANRERQLSGAESTLPGDDNGGGDGSSSALSRRQLYCHRSPSDALLVAVGRWLDANLPNMPNRYSRISSAPHLVLTPPREEVLDRFKYHTLICAPSLAAYNNAQLMSKACGLGAAVAALLVLASAASLRAAQGGGSPSQLLAAISSSAGGGWGTAAVVLALAAWAASWVVKQFTYVYTKEEQERDLARLAKITNEQARVKGKAAA